MSVLFPQCPQQFLTHCGYRIYNCETNIYLSVETKPSLLVCGRRENPLQWHDGSVPAGKSIPGECGQRGKPGEQVGLWEVSERQASVKGSKTARLCLILKKPMRRFLRNNRLQKRTSGGAKKAGDSPKPEAARKGRRLVEKVLGVGKIL